MLWKSCQQRHLSQSWDRVQVWRVFKHEEAFYLYYISWAALCQTKSSHKHSLSGIQSGAEMLSYKCLILIHTQYSIYCIQYLSKQNTFPHDRPFFGTLTSLGRQKWDFGMCRAVAAAPFKGHNNPRLISSKLWHPQGQNTIWCVVGFACTCRLNRYKPV